MPDRLPLTRAPRELANAGYPPVPYGRLYYSAVNAVIPAEQSITGRWTISRSDLDAVARALGLHRSMDTPHAVAA